MRRKKCLHTSEYERGGVKNEQGIVILQKHVLVHTTGLF